LVGTASGESLYGANFSCKISPWLATIVWSIFRFAVADADLTLLGKGPAKQHEFEDKVIWITGASQGIGNSLLSG
jgi:hypothetical protein